MRYHLAPAHWLDASKPLLKQRIDELLQRVLNISDEDAVYLNPNRMHLVERIEYPKKIFFGRDSEIKQIAEHFDHENVLFVQGMGGIGKSELAKRYAELFRTRYDTIIFTRYVSGLQGLFCSNEFLIENLQRGEKETLEAWYQRKINAFRRIVNEKTLLRYSLKVEITILMADYLNGYTANKKQTPISVRDKGSKFEQHSPHLTHLPFRVLS